MWRLSWASDSHALMSSYWIFRHLWIHHDYVLGIIPLFLLWSKKIIQLFSYLKANKNKYRIIMCIYSPTIFWVDSIYLVHAMSTIFVHCIWVWLQCRQYTTCLTSTTQLNLIVWGLRAQRACQLLYLWEKILCPCICHLIISKM